jgi:hypothetical protein
LKKQEEREKRKKKKKKEGKRRLPAAFAAIRRRLVKPSPRNVQHRARMHVNILVIQTAQLL